MAAWGGAVRRAVRAPCLGNDRGSPIPPSCLRRLKLPFGTRTPVSDLLAISRLAITRPASGIARCVLEMLVGEAGHRRARMKFLHGHYVCYPRGDSYLNCDILEVQCSVR